MSSSERASASGRYRILAVATATGVSAATLRAWERRYGVPSPKRTASAYRLYSDADIAQIRAMREHCEQGMAPAEAARLVGQTLGAEASGAAAPAAHTRATPLTPQTPFTSATLAAHDAHRQRILIAVAASDALGIEAALRSALLLGGAHDVYTRVFAPALREIGDRWCEGALDIAQEHMASELILAACKDLTRLVQPGPSSPSVLLGCVADETHSLPLYGVSLHLARCGLRSIVLGPRTPPSAIEHAVKATRPWFVGLSATVDADLETLRRSLGPYARACRGTPWVLGGAASAPLGEHVRSHGGLAAPEDWTETLLDAVLLRAGPAAAVSPEV